MGVPYSIFCCFKSTTEARLIDLESGGGGTYSTDVNTMLASADNAGIRTSIGLGTTGAPIFGGITIGTGNAKLQYTPGGTLTLTRATDGGAIFVANADTNNLGIGSINTDRITNRFTGANPAVLEMGGSGVIEQRNGSIKQKFLVYNNFISSTVYERAVMGWNAITGNLDIGTEFLGGSGMAAKQIDFATGGAVRMSIAAAGNVSIAGTFNFGSSNGALPGGTNYGGNLGTSQDFAIRSTSTTSTNIYIQNGSSSDKQGWVRVLGSGSVNHGALEVGAIDSSPVIFSTALTERMRLSAAGNLGIGTTAPAVPLDVLSTSTALDCANFTIKNNNSSWRGVRFGWSQSDGSSPFGLIIGAFNTAGAKLIKLYSDTGTSVSFASGSDDFFSFESRLLTSKGIGGTYHADLDIVLNQHTNGGSDKGIKFKLNGGSSTAMSIMETGNIGIGTASPVSKTDIADTWNAPALAVTAASGTGSTATLTFATQLTAIPVGSTIVVAGVTPSGYNGTFVVTGSTTSTVLYANATTGAGTGGTIERLFTSVKLNVTDTASNAASNLMDLQVGGVSAVKTSKAGMISIGNTFASGGFVFRPGNSNGGGIGMLSGVIGVWAGADSAIGFSSGAPLGGAVRLSLYADADNILAQRNGTLKQVHRVYNTALAGAPEWGGFDWQTTANTLRIGTDKSGTGASQPIDFVTGGVVRMSISAAGALNVIAAISSNSSITAGGTLSVGNSSVVLKDAGSLVLQFLNSGQTAGVVLDATTDGVAKFRLRGNAAFATLQGKLTTDTAYTATTVVATGYITLYDSTGTAYRVPCAV